MKYYTYVGNRRAEDSTTAVIVREGVTVSQGESVGLTPAELAQLSPLFVFEQTTKDEAETVVQDPPKQSAAKGAQDNESLHPEAPGRTGTDK